MDVIEQERRFQGEVVSLSQLLFRHCGTLGWALRRIVLGACLAVFAPVALAQTTTPRAVLPSPHGRRGRDASHRAAHRRRVRVSHARRRLRRIYRTTHQRHVAWSRQHRAPRAHFTRHRRWVHRAHVAQRAPTPRSVLASRLAVDAQSAYVVDVDSGAVLLSKRADVMRPIASLTKLMLASVVLDTHPSMTQVIHITSDDIDRLKWSSSRLEPGMAFTRRELLNLALMSSENRAAHALARHYPGGVAACVAAMNRKARQLGMLHTVYLDPTGLNPGNRSTAADLMRLVRAAAEYPLIREFSTDRSRRVVARGQTLMYRNTDHLVTDGWHLVLQKTGFINEAGHCLILDGPMDGRHVAVVLLGDPGGYADFADAEHIRAWLGREPAAAFAAITPGVRVPGPG